MLRGPIPALIAAGALAVATTGCGGSSGVTIDPVAQAADVTAHAGGMHMALTAQVTGAGLPSTLTMNGEGFFNFTAREGKLALDMSGLPAEASASLPGGSLHMEEIFDGSTIYVGSPLFAGKLPGGARWLKLDLDQLSGGLGFNPSQLTSGESNPAQMLEYLKAAGNVTVVGHDSIRGVPTTHYHGTIDVSRMADVLPSSDRAKLRATLEKVIAQTGLKGIPVNVWVDAHGLARRMTLSFALGAAGQDVQMQMTIDYFGFGSTPTVTAPSAAESFDGTQAALAGASQSGI